MQWHVKKDIFSLLVIENIVHALRAEVWGDFNIHGNKYF